jgi:uncharacterized membrane protein YuzA (DUF378 family)
MFGQEVPFMKNNCNCMVCKIVGILVIVGAINWGLVGAIHFDVVSAIFGVSVISRIIYIVIGVAGVLKLASCFKACPCNKQ